MICLLNCKLLEINIYLINLDLFMEESNSIDYANSYNDVLKKGLLQIYGRNDIFQQDSAPCHKPRVVSSFMYHYGICCLSYWSAQSPDLNITESLWFDLIGNVAKCRPVNIKDLWRTYLDK